MHTFCIPYACGEEIFSFRAANYKYSCADMGGLWGSSWPHENVVSLEVWTWVSGCYTKSLFVLAGVVHISLGYISYSGGADYRSPWVEKPAGMKNILLLWIALGSLIIVDLRGLPFVLVIP